jgi:hypothetical protein
VSTSAAATAAKEEKEKENEEEEEAKDLWGKRDFDDTDMATRQLK